MRLPQLHRNSTNLESTAVAHKPVQQQQFFECFFAFFGNDFDNSIY